MMHSRGGPTAPARAFPRPGGVSEERPTIFRRHLPPSGGTHARSSPATEPVVALESPAPWLVGRVAGVPRGVAGARRAPGRSSVAADPGARRAESLSDAR